MLRLHMHLESGDTIEVAVLIGVTQGNPIDRKSLVERKLNKSNTETEYTCPTSKLRKGPPN